MTKFAYITTLLLLTFCIPEVKAQSTTKPEQKGPSVGLVLSGGGAKGFAYVGLLKVLEEVDMPIDYIGGSSIGAIIAGMYSIGYSPDIIEQLIREQDWDKVISDEQERKYLSYEEKLFSDKYIFSIPIQDSSFSLSKSVSSSFNIDLLLNRLFAPSVGIEQFEDLPIPFLCIGTDLLTGEDIILDSGNVARAIRASMAIPGYFTPIHYQGHYLVDGGVVNNYPALQIKEKGMDIIIGGDVQAGLKTSEELNSATAILNQIISFNRTDANTKGLELTDHLIKITMPYGVMDFNRYDSIIAIGEQTARKHYTELKLLADSINTLRGGIQSRKKVTITDSIFINNVKWKDVNWRYREKIESYFREMENTHVSFDEIDNRLRILNGTRSFDEIHYTLSKEEDQINLNVLNDIPSLGSFAAGLHYDNIYLGSVLVNVSLRNLNAGRGKWFTDLVLGQNPRLKSMFIINNGFKPGFAADLDMYSFTFPEYNKGEKVNTLRFDNISASVFMPMTIRNNFMFKVGAKYELFRFKQDFVVDTLLDVFNEFADYGNVFLSFHLDTRDKVYFSESGLLTELKIKHVLPISPKWDNFFSNSTIIYLRSQRHIRLANKLVFKPGIFAGYTFIQSEPTPNPSDDEVLPISPAQHLFGFGGLNTNNYVEGHVPFTGLQFIEKIGQYGAILSADIQYNFYKKFYVTLMGDVGFNEKERANINIDQTLLGAGLKLSYDSFIGPVEISVMTSNENKSLSTFFNLGFWF